MDRFQEMRTFVQVVESGSFVKAAEPLGTSKAAVSRYLAELEARLEVRLLHRTTRRLSLTEEGEVFYLRCKELLQGLDAAEAEITSRTGEAIGQLKVNAPVSFGILHLAALWPRFRALHPKVHFEVTLSDRLVDIVEEGYDLAIRIARLETSSLISRKLASTRMVLCAAPAYLAQAGTPRHPTELAQHRVLAYSYWSDRDEWHFSGPQGDVTVKTVPVFRSNSGDTCRVGALAGEGLILQPSFMVGQDLASGALVEVCPDYRSIEVGIYAMYGSRKHVTPKVRLLIDFLAEAFAQPRWPA